MALELFIPPQPWERRYTGIHVGHGQIAVSINLARILEKGGWKRATIWCDHEAGVIELRKTDRHDEGFAIQWQHISANVARAMPTGRYYLEAEESEKITLKKKST